MKMIFFPQVGLGIKPEEWQRCGHYVVFSVSNNEGGKETEVDYDFEIPDGATFTQDEFQLAFEKYNNEGKVPCACCNHKIKRGAFFYNKLSQELIYVGLDCSQNILKYRFDVNGSKKQTIKDRKERLKLDAIEKAFAENKGLEEVLMDGEYNKIIRDIRERLFKWGTISEKQVDLVMKISAQRAEYVQTAKPLPVGKFEGELEVVSSKVNDITELINKYQRTTHTYHVQSVVLKHPQEGWKVWVKNFAKDSYKRDFPTKQGDKVNVRMSIEVSEKDPYFGFGKRVKWDIQSSVQ